MSDKKPYNTYEVNGKRYKIYPNDYLMNHKFTPDEINTFIADDEESYNIYASFTVNAWKFIKRPESELEALKMMSDDSEWFKKVTWTKEQRVEYEKDVHKILMNCIGLNSVESWNEVEYWLALGSSPGLDDYSDKNFSELTKMENELRYNNKDN